HAFPGVGFCLGEGQEIDWIGHTEYSETRIEQLDHIFNLIGITTPFIPTKGRVEKPVCHPHLSCHAQSGRHSAQAR
ncbi:hypothetical protein, partial [Aeromonas veronii]|uniref:hypothetical protein n=1 Tax=Aeromonas veronii TaxID=654 RepID=UPI001A7F027D